jgi:hypothetical protein
MWPRVVEAMLGCWLILSPFIFSHPVERTEWWMNDMASGAAIIALALASYWGPLKRIHLASVGIALWLIAYGYFSATPLVPPALQNDIVLGLLAGMLAIIPSEANLPPESWRKVRAG